MTRAKPKNHGLYQRAAERRKKVLALLEAEPDIGVVEISRRLNTPQTTISDDLTALGIASTKSRAAVADRRRRIAELAASGATSHQIAKQLGITRKGVADIAKRYRIPIPGDVATRGHHRLDADEVLANFTGGLLTRVSNFESIMEGRWDEVSAESGAAADVDLEQMQGEIRRVRRGLLSNGALPERWSTPRDDGTEQRQASINITPEQWREFKIQAQSTGDSAAAVLGQLVEDYLRRSKEQ